ncbi:synaptogenesis protein syg-2-like [Saccoglossus kowalevskii]
MVCTAEGSPQPTYQWYKLGGYSPVDERYTFNDDGSELIINPCLRNDTGSYECTAVNDEGTDSTWVFLDIYYEPVSPWPNCSVDPMNNTEYLEAGYDITIVCEASGGNPYPYLVWYNGTDRLPGNYSTPSTGDDNEVTTNEYSWMLDKYDNGKYYRCHGDQAVSGQEQCYTDQLDVKYSPETPSCTDLTRDSYVEGSVITITCESTDGNPLATLRWLNETDDTVMLLTTPMPGDETSTAVYEWVVSRVDNHGSFRCEAVNLVQLDPLICTTGSVDVVFSPTSVELFGYERAVNAGDDTILTCESGTSNPKSNITWFKNNTLIVESEYEECGEEWYNAGDYYGIVTRQDIIIHLTAQHNSAVFYCSANNNIYDIVISNSNTLEVYFPPSEPDGCRTSLTGYNGYATAGGELTLTCTSCSSNPRSRIMWYVDGSEVQDGLSEPGYTHAEYNGVRTSQDLSTILSYLHHAVTVWCECVNEVYPDDSHPSDHITLDVHYGPFVTNIDETRSRANEGEIGNLTCVVDSNPDGSITWYNPEDEKIINGTEGRTIVENKDDTIRVSRLIIEDVTRADYGNYTCCAENYINTALFVIELNGLSKFIRIKIID